MPLAQAFPSAMEVFFLFRLLPRFLHSSSFMSRENVTCRKPRERDPREDRKVLPLGRPICRRKSSSVADTLQPAVMEFGEQPIAVFYSTGHRTNGLPLGPRRAMALWLPLFCLQRRPPVMKRLRNIHPGLPQCHHRKGLQSVTVLRMHFESRKVSQTTFLKKEGSECVFFFNF